MNCRVCGVSCDQPICGECDGDYPCLLCKENCYDPWDRIKMSCGELLHFDCAQIVKKLGGICPGQCASRYKEGQVAYFQAIAIDTFLEYRLKNEVLPKTLELELRADLQADNCYWLLTCIYANGIGVRVDIKSAEAYRRKATALKDPNCMYYQAKKCSDIHLMMLSAEQGSHLAATALMLMHLGYPSLGYAIKANPQKAAEYAEMENGAMHAILSYNAGKKNAEALLKSALKYRIANHEIYCRARACLADIYMSRKQVQQAFFLSATISDPTDETYFALGVACSAFGNYRAGMEAFLRSNSPRGYVCIATLLMDGISPTVYEKNTETIESCMQKAGAGGHPDAALYFLLRTTDPAEIAHYTPMLANAQDRRFFIRAGVDFAKAGKPELAAECVRLRNAMPMP